MPRTTEPMPILIYQLKVTLNHSKPPIWRRIQVRGDTTLARLHDILQVVMGWHDYHLHAFRVDGVEYGQPNPDLPMRSDKSVALSRIIPGEKFRFRYEYDFGDSWEHVLVVEKLLSPEPGVDYPRCIAGKRACPPEDVGGIWSYPEFLAAIQDPLHPQHAEQLEWIGGSFDPEAFDLERVNRRLAGMHAAAR
jgi:hypothetical protein